MSSISLKRAVAVVGVSALVFASAAGYFMYYHRKVHPEDSSKSKSPRKKRQISPSKSVKKRSSASLNNDENVGDDEGNSPEDNRDCINGSSPEENVETSANLNRRQLKENPAPTTTVKSKSIIQMEENGLDEEDGSEPAPSKEATVVSKNPTDPKVVNVGINGWAEEVERAESSASSEAEIVSSAVNGESVPSMNGTRNQQPSFGRGSVPQSNLRQTYAQSPAVSSIKSQCADSPSVGSDLHSEASQDSGKGASVGVTASMSPVEEQIELPAVYEFEVPRDIVGLLIGKKGETIKRLTEQSEAYIVIRDHFYSETHKICTLEGTREQINKCLRLIRRKFPPSRFPQLRLTPILPAPVPAPRTPVWDNVAQLSLPEGVNCEVAVSSIVDIGHVFLQQPTHPSFPSLTRLDQYMLTVYSQPAAVPPLPRPIELGVICAAPVLGGWYRAQTINFYDDTEEVLVRFVDYGGYCSVSSADLRQIRSDFMTLPFQASECYLANIAPAEEVEGWSSEALSLFEQLSLGKIIEARVVGHQASGNMPLVELYTSNDDSKSVLINRVLVDRGYAIWTDA